MKDLEEKFHEAMLSIYVRAKAECGYNATRFLQMVNEHGGLQTARLLLHGPPSEGFTALLEYDRLDLTMEALILKEPWRKLFSKDQLESARSRLVSLGYTPQETSETQQKPEG